MIRVVLLHSLARGHVIRVVLLHLFPSDHVMSVVLLHSLSRGHVIRVWYCFRTYQLMIRVYGPKNIGSVWTQTLTGIMI